MASTSRTIASLRFRATRTFAQRFNSTASPADAPSTNAQASSSKIPSNDSSTTSTETAPASPEAADATPTESSDATTSESSSSSTSPAFPQSLFAPGMTAWGPTKNYKQEVALGPKSHQLLPMQEAPAPPWHEGPVGIYHINYPRPLFPSIKRENLPNEVQVLGGDRQERRMKVLSATSGLSPGELRGLKRCTVDMRYVVNMTKKGKMRSMRVYVVVGDPVKGLVGMGRGRGSSPGTAVEAAFYDAVMQMDTVNRYEGRTLWGQGKELVTKFASTKVSLRARPPGHGLMVPHAVHRVLSACGIKDASAQIDGSTTPINVMKAVIQLLHGGANPTGFGDGVGGHGKRENKGASMRSKDEIERSRGRYGVDIGLRV